jgi:hypothetical protein
MKKLLISVLLLPVLASAQGPVTVEKKVVCHWANVILESLAKDFEEKPIWAGVGADKTRYSLFTNTTGSWTLIQFNEEVACIIGAGTMGREIFQGPKT